VFGFGDESPPGLCVTLNISTMYKGNFRVFFFKKIIVRYPVTHDH
jgi:hypothetical protein